MTRRRLFVVAVAATLAIPALLCGKDKPDFSGHWRLDFEASDDIDAALEHVCREWELDRRQNGRTPRSYPVPNVPVPGTTPGVIGTHPPTGPASPPIPPGRWPTPPSGTPPTRGTPPGAPVCIGTVGLPDTLDELALLYRAVLMSGAGAREIFVERQGEVFLSTEDGEEIKWALDGSVKATWGPERNARWRSHRMFAEERLVDGSRLTWTWQLRKDGRLQITTLIAATELSGHYELPRIEIRSLYHLVE